MKKLKNVIEGLETHIKKQELNFYIREKNIKEIYKLEIELHEKIR